MLDLICDLCMCRNSEHFMNRDINSFRKHREMRTTRASVVAVKEQMKIQAFAGVRAAGVEVWAARESGSFKVGTEPKSRQLTHL